MQYTATASDGATVTLCRRDPAAGVRPHSRPAPQAGHALLRGRDLVAGGRRRAGQPHLRARHGRMGRSPDPPRAARAGLSARHHPPPDHHSAPVCAARSRPRSRRRSSACSTHARRARCAPAAAKAWRSTAKPSAVACATAPPPPIPSTRSAPFATTSAACWRNWWSMPSSTKPN